MRVTSLEYSTDYLKPSYTYTGAVLGIILGEINLFFLLFPFAEFFVTFGKWINLTSLTNMINTVLAILSVAYIFFSAKNIRIRWAQSATMFMLAGLIMASYLWTDPAMKADSKSTILRTIFTIFQTMAIVKIFFEKSDEYLFDVLKRIAIIICVMSTLSIAIFPAESSWTVDDTGRKQAFFSSPNNLGQFLSFAFLIINFYKLNQYKWYTILLLNAMIIYQAMGCDSKTSLTGGILCFILYHLRFLVRPFLIFVICAGLYLPYYTQQFAPGEAEKIEFAKRDMSFTGRSDVWHIMLDDLKDYNKEYFGFGAGGYWGEKTYHPKARMHELDWEPHQGHNGYLDIRMMGGLVAVIIFLGFLFQYFTNIFKRLTNENIFMLFMSVIFCINNITETSFFRTKHFFFVLLMVIFWYTNFKKTKREESLEEEAAFEDEVINENPPVKNLKLHTL